MNSGFILIFVIIILVVILVVVNSSTKRYNNKIMKEKAKIRWKYLDTFFYSYLSGVGDNSNHVYIIFHIVSDINSGKIYAIPESSFTNATHRVLLNDFDVLKGKGFINKLKKIEIGDCGSLWIDKEMNDCYYHDNEMIKLSNRKVIYSKENDKNSLKASNIQPHNLFNLNAEYDISLLDKATFVYGVAEFDVEN